MFLSPFLAKYETTMAFSFDHINLAKRIAVARIYKYRTVEITIATLFQLELKFSENAIDFEMEYALQRLKTFLFSRICFIQNISDDQFDWLAIYTIST